MRRGILLGICLLSSMAAGCSRGPDVESRWLEQGRAVLSGAASDGVPSGIYIPDEVWGGS